MPNELEPLTNVKNRVLGTLVGLPIGDALGAPAECRKRGKFQPVTSMRAGGTFGLPMGAWTDDTAMVCALQIVYCITQILM